MGDRPRSGFLRNVAILAGGTGAAQLLLVAATPLISRIFDPAVIGTFGVFISAVMFGVVLAPAGYHLAIVSADDSEDAAQLTLGSFAVVSVSSVVLGLSAAALIATGSLGFGALPMYAAPLCTATILITCIFETLRFWFVRLESYPILARTTALQGFGRAFAPVALGLSGFGLSGLILGDMVGRVLGVTTIARLGMPQVLEAARGYRWDRIRTVLLRYRRYPLYQLPSRSINSAAQLLPIPLVMSLYGPTTAGLFVMVERVFGVPSSFLGRAVGDVFHARMTEYNRTSPDSAIRLFMLVGTGLFASAAVGGAAIITVGEEMFAFVLGSEWRPAGTIAAIVTPWAVMRFAIAPLSRVVFVYDALGTKLLYDLVSLASVLVSFWVAKTMDLSTLECFQLLNGLNVVSYGIYGVLLLRIVRMQSSISRPSPSDPSS